GPAVPASCSARWPSGKPAASAAPDPFSGPEPTILVVSGPEKRLDDERQAAEAFGVADAGGTPALLGPLPEELPEPLARLGQLALVAEEGVDLRLDVVADVDPAVGLQGPREVHRRHMVRGQPGGQLLREIVGVPGPG